MYEHVAKFIDEIVGLGFAQVGNLDAWLTNALYGPKIVDTRYRETLDGYGLEGGRPWQSQSGCELLTGMLTSWMSFAQRG